MIHTEKYLYLQLIVINNSKLYYLSVKSENILDNLYIILKKHY